MTTGTVDAVETRGRGGYRRALLGLATTAMVFGFSTTPTTW